MSAAVMHLGLHQLLCDRIPKTAHFQTLGVEPH